MESILTVFTPTFNRAYVLRNLYESLLAQTCSSFSWLIVDDGSSDGTKALVDDWISEGLIDVRYVAQPNMGMVAAHNTAICNITTELFVCIDSDDRMPDTAVETILAVWDAMDSSDLMGIVGLDIYESGEVIGDLFPKSVATATFSELKYKYKVKGDKKYVLKTKLAKEVLPYPYVESEKFPAPSYIYLKLEDKYKFYLLNHPLCIVEYLPDGNSMNKVAQYRASPNAFALYRIAQIQHGYGLADKFKNTVHYICAKLIGRRAGIYQCAPNKLMFLLALPFGLMLYIYISRTSRKTLSLRLNRK